VREVVVLYLLFYFCLELVCLYI